MPQKYIYFNQRWHCMLERVLKWNIYICVYMKTSPWKSRVTSSSGFFRYNETLYCVQAVPKINFILYVKKAEWNERVSEMERKSERKKKEYVFFWFMVIWFFLVNLYISCASTTSTSKKKLKAVWIIPKSHSQPKINHAIWN